MTEDRPERTFTVEEAEALLPALIPLLESLRVAARDVIDSRPAVRGSSPSNGGGEKGRTLLDASRTSERALKDLAGLGVIVRDTGTGLVDFPSRRAGRPVYLCWRLGEPRIGWWHPIDSGVTGRRPLEER